MKWLINEKKIIVSPGDVSLSFDMDFHTHEILSFLSFNRSFWFLKGVVLMKNIFEFIF